MSDRITNGQMHRSMLSNVYSAQKRMMAAQEQLSSGFALQRPSDDPLKAARTMSLLSETASLDQYESNLNQAITWTEVSDTALGKVSDLVERARTLMLQASNDTYGATERQKAANELAGIIDAIKVQANTKLGEEYLFAGSASLSQPYALGAGDAYAGNAGQVVREIAPGVQVSINELGSGVFGDNTGGLLRVLRDAITHMTSGAPGDMDLLRGADLNALDAASGAVVDARARLGELQQRFEFNLDRVGELRVSTSELLADVRDTDYGMMTMLYLQRQAAFEAALKTGQGVVQPSLVSFLK